MSEECLFHSFDTSMPAEEKILSDGTEVAGTKTNGPNKYLLTTKQGGHCQGRTFPICSVLTPSRKNFRPSLAMRL